MRLATGATLYAYENRKNKTLRFISGALQPGAQILDIAAAQGNFSIALAEMGYNVTWNDLRADLADYVRLKQDKGAIELAPGNVFELNFPAPFDAVLITENHRTRRAIRTIFCARPRN